MERLTMAGSNLVEVTDTSFPAEVEQHKGLAVVDFWAEWCGPCKMIAPILDQLATEYGPKGLKVVKLDVDANNATAMRFNVRSIPTLLFFKDGRPVDSVVGAQPKAKLVERIDRHLAA
jgi:thioredoxin 1